MKSSGEQWFEIYIVINFLLSTDSKIKRTVAFLSICMVAEQQVVSCCSSDSIVDVQLKSDVS